MPSSFRVEPLSGTLAERPTPQVGVHLVYFAHDEGTTWISLNGEWIQVGQRSERVNFICPTDTPVKWKNMPDSRTEFLEVDWLRFGARAYGLRYAQIIPNIVTPAGAGSFLAIEYSVDNEVTWLDFSPGADCPISTAGHNPGPLATIVPGAIIPTPIRLRVVSQNGGLASPEFGRITIVFR